MTLNSNLIVIDGYGHLTYLFILAIVVIAFTFSMIIPIANAETDQIKHVGIEWSEACVSIIDSGDLETCGDPAILKSAYLEPRLKATYQKMFDDVEETEKAPYQKNSIYGNHVKSCIFENYCNVFESGSSVFYWFEIPNNVRSYMDKIITIHPNLKHTNLNIHNEQVFTFDDARFLILDTNQINIKGCYQITYSPEIYRMTQEIGLIMWHILDNCRDNAKLGFLSEPYLEELQLSTIPVNESPAWLELQRLEALKTKYLENRIGLD